MPCAPGGVVQLVRTPACHAGGRGFESRRSRSLHIVCLRAEDCSKKGFLGLDGDHVAVVQSDALEDERQQQAACFRVGPFTFALSSLGFTDQALTPE